MPSLLPAVHFRKGLCGLQHTDLPAATITVSTRDPDDVMSIKGRDDGSGF
jgi:hypothetical protein